MEQLKQLMAYADQNRQVENKVCVLIACFFLQGKRVTVYSPYRVDC